jgi:hypothetical protein
VPAHEVAGEICCAPVLLGIYERCSVDCPTKTAPRPQLVTARYLTPAGPDLLISAIAASAVVSAGRGWCVWPRMDGTTHDRLSCDGKIGPHGPDRMTGEVTQGPRQIAFNDMPRDTDRRPRTDQHNASLSSTQQHRNCTYDRQTVLDDRAPAIERVEVLSPMFSRELVIRRNHPWSIRQAGQPSQQTSGRDESFRKELHRSRRHIAARRITLPGLGYGVVHHVQLTQSCSSRSNFARLTGGVDVFHMCAIPRPAVVLSCLV